MSDSVVAIQPDDYGEGDASSPIWAELLRSAGFEVKWVNVYQADVLQQVRGCIGFMWRHGHFGGMGKIARRLLPVLEHELGLVVYPDAPTSWHYDDKIAQAFLFEALGIPSPRTWVWFDGAAALKWAASTTYPKVLKLSAGAASTNVRLVESETEARRWIKRLFGPGVTSLDDAEFSPRARLTAGWALARARLPYRMPHHGYVLFQEFLPGNSWDTRVTVIGDRAFGYRRHNRPGDFRASGSGRRDYDGVDERFVRLAFKTARLLESKSCAIDGLWDGEAAVTSEVSYTYVSKSVRDCPGHWELDGDPEEGRLRWIPGHMWPEEAQIQDFLVRLRRRARQ